MKERTCIKCGSHAFNLKRNGIDQGGFCDVHYWQGVASRLTAELAHAKADIESLNGFMKLSGARLENLTTEREELLGVRKILSEQVADLMSKRDAALVDAKRLAWVYSQHQTTSDALVALEMRMFNRDYPTIEEVRIAIDDAIAKEKI